MDNDKTHITADVPTELLKKVDAHVKTIGVSRSFAIRKGLSLFLSTIRQDLTETVNEGDSDEMKQEIATATN